jgi:Fur family peroxide stress response transcriptional regulator
MQKQVEFLRKLCRENGMKITTQRLGVFLIVERAQDHPSALDVYKRIKSRHPTTSHDTVYRTLNTFAEWGLIDKVEYLDAKIRFDPNVKPHHHFICTECGSIRDFYWSDFDEVGLPPGVVEWGQPKTRHAQIKGVCAECQKKRNK